MKDKWINCLFRLVFDRGSTVAWFQALTRVHRTTNVVAQLSIDVHNVQEQMNELLGRVDGVVVAARQAAKNEVRYRKGELDAQERRVEESLRAAEGVASAITVAGSDLSVELREFIKQVTNESAHYSIKQNRWYGPGFEPWSASHPDADNDTEADTDE